MTLHDSDASLTRPLTLATMAYRWFSCAPPPCPTTVTFFIAGYFFALANSSTRASSASKEVNVVPVGCVAMSPACQALTSPHANSSFEYC